jgi:hypothetical protein
VPERDGPQVADAAPRRVRVAVVDDEALRRRDVAAEERLDLPELERRAKRGDAPVVEPQQQAVALGVELRHAHDRGRGQRTADGRARLGRPSAAATAEEHVAAVQLCGTTSEERPPSPRAREAVELVEQVRRAATAASVASVRVVI